MCDIMKVFNLTKFVIRLMLVCIVTLMNIQLKSLYDNIAYARFYLDEYVE